jgi:ketosteroid isomerase-like protein
VRALVALVAAAVLLGGCGGDSGNDDQKKIKATIVAYYKAFGNGDMDAACQEFASETREELEKAAGGRDCSKVLDQARQQKDYAKIAQKLASVKVSNVQIASGMATAKTTVPGVEGPGGKAVTTTIPLKKEKGTWKIASTIDE